MNAINEDRLSIREAAKLVRKSRCVVLEWIYADKLPAMKIGGTNKTPWLAVKKADLLRVAEEQLRFTPPGVPKRRPLIPLVLDPAVAGW